MSPSLEKLLSLSKTLDDELLLSDISSFSRSIKARRQRMNITLEKLAQKTGFSASYLSRLEQGQRRLNADVLHKVSQALECSPSDLLDSPQTTTASFTSHQNLALYDLLPSDCSLYKRVDFTTPREWIFRPQELSQVSDAFALLVGDDHLAPKYAPGDVIYVHPTDPVKLKSPCSVLLKNGQILVRQFLGWFQDDLLLSSFTKEYHPPREEMCTVQRGHIQAVYKLIGSMSRY